jgi:hypothetical protein
LKGCLYAQRQGIGWVIFFAGNPRNVVICLVNYFQFVT